MSRSVAIATVTWNSASELPGFFEAVAKLEHRPLELVVVDCGSTDVSAAMARELSPLFGGPCRIVELGENRGYAGGMNAALAATEAEAVLALNPDTRPDPDFVTALLAALDDEDRAGAVTGRLVRMEVPGRRRQLDACGMHLTWTWRHLDRGAGEVDDGQFSNREWVFGGTGAATLYRREALDDVAVDGEAFDADFHSYREDAELAFRLAERGWGTLYEPSACCVHRRRVTPARRREVDDSVNYHSVKNRFLLRAYHQVGLNALWTGPATLMRDLAALAWMLGIEHSSLPALTWLWRHRRRIADRRRRIQERRTAPRRDVDRWFLRRAVPVDSP